MARSAWLDGLTSTAEDRAHFEHEMACLDAGEKLFELMPLCPIGISRMKIARTVGSITGRSGLTMGTGLALPVEVQGGHLVPGGTEFVLHNADLQSIDSTSIVGYESIDGTATVVEVFGEANEARVEEAPAPQAAPAPVQAPAPAKAQAPPGGGEKA